MYYCAGRKAVGALNGEKSFQLAIVDLFLVVYTVRINVVFN